jgi:enediyne biosynthesis protein E3
LLTLKALRRLIMGLPLDEAGFDRRGFHMGRAQERIERVAKSLLIGYNLTVDDSRLSTVLLQLGMIENEVRGLAYEGAAMALTLLDTLTPGSNAKRLRGLMESSPRARYLTMLGAGMALGVFRYPFAKLVAQMDPLLGWVIVDGFGFYYGLLRTKPTIYGHFKPRACTGFSGRMYDAGVGRSLWFAECGEVKRVVETLQRFAPERHGDLWSGVGVACTYAGGVEREELQYLMERADKHLPALAQGCAFASYARHEFGNAVAHVDLAAQTIWSRPSADLKVVFEEARDEARAAGPGNVPPYAFLLDRVQHAFRSAATIPSARQMGA